MIDRFADIFILLSSLAVSLGIWAILIGAFVVLYRSRRSPLTRALLVIVPLLLLDGFAVGQGVWSTVIFLVGFGAQLILAVVALSRRRGWLARRRLVASLLYAGSIVAVVAWIGGNNQLARDRADEIILACRRYEVVHETLPRTLDELVPAYLSGVPRAKYTLAWSEFRYAEHQPLTAREDAALGAAGQAASRGDHREARAGLGQVGVDRSRDAILVALASRRGLAYDGGGPLHSLRYCAIPPFGRAAYFFEEDRWLWID